MAKITRKTAKVFGSNAGAQQVAQFGSLAVSSIAYSTDPAVIQSLAGWQTGWFGATVGGNSPAIEDENAVDYVHSYQIGYLMQTGIPEYDAGTTYYSGSVVQDGNGNIRVSTVDSNTGNGASLLTDAAGTHWRVPAGHVPIGAVIATFPNLTGAYSTTATTAADAAGWVLCGGQTIADATSPMNGQVVPNINNNVFLMGSTVAGASGGSNTIVSHVHNMSHAHVAAFYSALDLYGIDSTRANITHLTAMSGGGTDQAVYAALQVSTGAGVNYAAISGGGYPGTGALYTTGVALNDNTGTGATAVTGAPTVAVDSRPAFVGSVYLMRIK